MAYQILTWSLTPPQKDDGRIRVRQWYYLFDWSVSHQSNQQQRSCQIRDWAEVIKMAASFRVLPRELTVASFSSFGKSFHETLLKFCLQTRALHSCGSGYQSWLVRLSWVTGMIQIDNLIDLATTWPAGTELLCIYCIYSILLTKIVIQIAKQEMEVTKSTAAPY